MSEARNRNWGLWALGNAAVSAWLIYDMSTAIEAPSLALAAMQYFLLALSLFAFVGSITMYFMQTSKR